LLSILPDRIRFNLAGHREALRSQPNPLVGLLFDLSSDLQGNDTGRSEAIQITSAHAITERIIRAPVS
jgi:hypothetical protein